MVSAGKCEDMRLPHGVLVIEVFARLQGDEKLAPEAQSSLINQTKFGKATFRPFLESFINFGVKM